MFCEIISSFLSFYHQRIRKANKKRVILFWDSICHDNFKIIQKWEMSLMLTIPPAVRYESVCVRKIVSSNIEASLHQSFRKIIMFFRCPPSLTQHLSLVKGRLFIRYFNFDTSIWKITGNVLDHFDQRREPASDTDHNLPSSSKPISSIPITISY